MSSSLRWPEGDDDEAAFIVNVTVTDVNEPPSIPQRAPGLPSGEGPTFSMSTTTREIAENTPSGTGIGDPVAATHPDPHEALAYSLVGEDWTFFDVATSTGLLRRWTTRRASATSSMSGQRTCPEGQRLLRLP